MPLDIPNLRSGRGKAMLEYFNELGKDAFTKSHWELAGMSAFSVDEWREFLTDPAVVRYIRDEMQATAAVETRKIVANISANAKSTGTAQTLMALGKTKAGDIKKEGPVFIYMAVPLNERERHAPNAQLLDTDPFRVPKG